VVGTAGLHFGKSRNWEVCGGSPACRRTGIALRDIRALLARSGGSAGSALRRGRMADRSGHAGLSSQDGVGILSGRTHEAAAMVQASATSWCWNVSSRVYAAGNGDCRAGIGFGPCRYDPMPTPLRNRFVPLDSRSICRSGRSGHSRWPSPEVFDAFLVQAGVLNALIVIRTRSSPRSWEFVSRILNSKPDHR